MTWNPTRIIRQRREEPIGTSSSPVVVETDAGDAYIKALGNNEGPHALACDWIGTHVASLLGLRTFATAILRLEYSILRPGLADLVPGPVFATQAMAGMDWDGTAEMLERLENPEDLTGLVVLDCLIRNQDRCLPNGRGPGLDRRNVRNVFLAEGSRRRHRLVVAMDHTHCLGRRSGGSIPAKADTIDAVQDDVVFGLFREFIPFISRDLTAEWMGRLASIEPAVLGPIMSAVPPQWDVDEPRLASTVGLLARRAAWLRY